MEQTIVNPTFNSSLTVFAEKVQEERLARRHYLSLLKRGTEQQKKEARERLYSIESEVDSLCTGVLFNRERRPQRQWGG